LTPHSPQLPSPWSTQLPPQQSCPAPQARPHTPQFSGSLRRSRHPAAPQQADEPVHAGPPLQVQPTLPTHWLPFVHEQPPEVHVPDEHCCPFAHALSHAPQCAGSLEVSKQPPGPVGPDEQQR
jgi:hypothetical protein